MNALEKLQLARAGFKASEIREMEKAEKEQPNNEPIPQPKEEPEPQPNPQPNKEPEKLQEIKAENKEPEKEPEPQPDFESLYKEEREKLKKIQEDNRNKDLSNKIASDEEIAREAIRSFL